MSDRLPPFSALRTFESAARHLSFRKAAEELHVTPSAISQQVRGLEDWLGVHLFRRVTRGIELTPAGQAMLPGIREGFSTIASALNAVRPPKAGALDVSAPPTFASRWLLPRLQRFKSAHPGVDLGLTSTMAMVDGREADPAHVPPPLDPRDGPVAAIRYGEGVYPGVRVDRIFQPPYVPVCSPLLLEGGQGLRALADLRHHTLIHDDTIPPERSQPIWERLLEGRELPEVDARRGPRFGNADLAIDAAVDGQGVALALRPMVEPEIQAGRLVIPFAAEVPSPYGYFVLTEGDAHGRPALEAFRAWLLEEAVSAGQ